MSQLLEALGRSSQEVGSSQSHADLEAEVFSQTASQVKQNPSLAHICAIAVGHFAGLEINCRR